MPANAVVKGKQPSIINTKKKDSGLYKCQASNSLGNKEGVTLSGLSGRRFPRPSLSMHFGNVSETNSWDHVTRNASQSRFFHRSIMRPRDQGRCYTCHRCWGSPHYSQSSGTAGSEHNPGNIARQLAWTGDPQSTISWKEENGYPLMKHTFMLTCWVQVLSEIFYYPIAFNRKSATPNNLDIF